jgi:type IV pilus assembly protein PilV
MYWQQCTDNYSQQRWQNPSGVSDMSISTSKTSHLGVCTPPSQRGVTLVEVLVTVVIISVGLLGVAALHLNSLRNNFDALKRTQASILAGDIADRMRANRIVALNQGYNATAPVDPQAGRDVLQWQTSLSTLLPSGVGTISLPAGSKIATIQISWTEHNSSTTLTFQTLTEI